MKTVTLVCAIVLTLSTGLEAYFFLQNLPHYDFTSRQCLGQALGVLSQGSLVVFFFTLYSRQK
jgi:hypothetical protein